MSSQADADDAAAVTPAEAGLQDETDVSPAALPPPVAAMPAAAEEQEGETWEAPLFASVEMTYGGACSTENILAWSKEQFKGLTVCFSPIYKPSDPTAWTRLKEDLQTAAAKEGFSLVSKGSKSGGAGAAEKTKMVLICSRGRVVPNNRSKIKSTRPLVAAECCRFRLTVHQDHGIDRYFVKGGQGCSIHKFHGKLEDGKVSRKRGRSKISSGNRHNITWHSTHLGRHDRWKNHKGAVLWFTGLSGSGKSTIANEVENILHKRHVYTYLLDGDNLRHGLNQDLGFSPDHRMENLRRTAECAKLMADAGMVVLCAFVSPYHSHRERVKQIVTSTGIPFVEVYVKASVATCEKRDPKGLYLKARAGILPKFTGISDPYEEPPTPDVELDSNEKSVQLLADEVVQYLDFSGKLEKE